MALRLVTTDANVVQEILDRPPAFAAAAAVETNEQAA